MACKRGCARRFREAAVRAGWYLVTEGEWAGWWSHDELVPYIERRFREDEIDKHHTKLTIQHPSIRKEALGFAKKVASDEARKFLNRLGIPTP
jgi:hypothetical protein